MNAHQYNIKVIKEVEEKENISFDYTKANLKNTIIKQISRSDAYNTILEYEWLKSIPPFSKYYFGLFFIIDNKEYLGSVVVFGEDYNSNASYFNKFTFKDEMLLLSRGVSFWWTPKNTASYFISKVYKILIKDTKYRVITATVDAMAGEVGIIYQSLNWYFLDSIDDKTNKKFTVLLDGVLHSSRAIKRKVGSVKKQEILKVFPNAVIVNQQLKKRYIYFLGKNKKKYTQEVSDIITKYPTKDSLNKEYFGLIYKITNIITNKIYIGQTTRSFNQRINEYKKITKINNTYLKNSITKYGFDNFNFEIIDSCSNLLELNHKEVYWIKYYDSTNREKGYNILSGGVNSYSSTETKEKKSDSHKNIKQNGEWINKRISTKGSDEAKKYGLPKTDEEKKHLSDNFSGENSYWFGKKRDLSNMRKTKMDKYGKKVVQYNRITNEDIQIFNSIGEACKLTGRTFGTITTHCNNKVKKYISDISYKWL